MRNTFALEKRDIFFWLCQLDKASTLMTVEEGIAPANIGTQTALALRKIIADADLPGAERPTDYLQVGPLLRAIVGPDSSRIHAGRSRQDILATVHRLLLRDRLLLVLHGLSELRAGLLRLAAQYRTAVLPAYTNGVQAQPVTFGHLTLGYEATLQRASQRLIEAFPRVNSSPLGGAALATSSFPVNRMRLAELLGFDQPVQNSFDAVQLSPIDVGFEVAAGAMGLALSVGTFVQDVHAQFHHAKPWLLLDDDALLAPSTLMPQKRNPAALNRARLLASEVVGDGVSTAFAAHNVSSGLTDYKRGEAARTLERTVAMLAEVNAIVAALRVDSAAALAEVRADYSTTSELANILQRDADVPFHTGHQFASELVTFGRGAGLLADEIPLSEAQRIYRAAAGHEIPLDEAQFRSALDPVAMVAGFRGLGGPQAAEFERMHGDSAAALASDNDWLLDVESRLSVAESTLDEQLDALAQSAN